MVTDKTKKALKDYYMKNHVSNKDMSYISWHQFQELDLAFKWGVYLEFFDSVDLIIELVHRKHFKHWEFWINENETTDNESIEFETRKEAQAEAIKKANDLFNESNR